MGALDRGFGPITDSRRQLDAALSGPRADPFARVTARTRSPGSPRAYVRVLRAAARSPGDKRAHRAYLAQMRDANTNPGHKRALVGAVWRFRGE
jgi:hypothetical protein